jgi:ABC-type transport system involved in multi-copper enzyme maturation permease subunit
MTFLPIVDRELRTASRRRATFRVRWWAALLAFGLTFFSIVVMAASRPGSAGSSVFSLLTGYAFGLSLLAGVFLTADTLTAEKRDGTLGLLFLTNLKGYDVVLGKFIAQSLNAFYCLLALLPITALPILLGGVEGAEFWRTALALANALFFSLAAGICVSALMRDSHRAMANTLGLILLAAACLPAAGQLLAAIKKAPSALQVLPYFSPFYPFSYASEVLYARHATTYWASFGCSQLLAWGFLIAASFVLPRVLRERGSAPQGRAKRFRKLDPVARASRRTRLLEGNPVRWLGGGEVRTPWPAWWLSFAWLACALAVGLIGDAEGPMLLAYFSIPFGFLLKVLFAAQACRFFAEARSNGALELMLCTPLTDRQVISGQVSVLWRAFSGPLILFVAGLFVPALIRFVSLLSASRFEPMVGIVGGTLLSGAQLLRLVGDLFAIQWVGMALALTGKRPRLAPALTILWVLVLPSFLFFCYLDLVVDLVLILWGRNKCRQNLRRLVAEQYQVPSV